MTEEDFARLAELGIEDPNAVVGEAFSQWVVEDDFPLGRPAGSRWRGDGRRCGALRNHEAAHAQWQPLAAGLPGALDGIETVAEAVGRDDLVALLRRYMLDEAAPTLAMPEGTDLTAYAEQLLARFANDSLRHRLQQIAMDGSQKLPQRWLHGARRVWRSMAM